MKPLYFLTGFLGSGKTTALQHMLARHQELWPQEPLAVVVNDFGPVSVDATLLDGHSAGTVHEINGGSLFCSCLKANFFQSLIKLAEEPGPVIVEASGMGDPTGIARTLEMAGLGASYAPPVSLCFFDPLKSLKLAQVLDIIPRQVRAAHRVLITKADLAGPDEIARCREYISGHNHVAPVTVLAHGQTDWATVLEKTAPEGGEMGAVTLNTPDTRPDVLVLRDTALPLPRLLEILSASPDVLRAKGYLRTPEGVFFLSDRGRDFEVRPCPEALAPLTILCRRGSEAAVGALLTRPAR